MIESPYLEKLTIGFIGIGGYGSLGLETVRKLYDADKGGLQSNIRKIYIKNTDTPKSLAVMEEFTRKVLNCKNRDVEYGSVETMVRDCDIIVLGFEKSFGTKTGANIPLDAYIRQNLLKGNVEELLKEPEKPEDIPNNLKCNLPNYKGLLIDATNPPEGMCYWLQKLYNLSKNQVIGLMPDTDRFNKLCLETYENESMINTALSPDEKYLISRGFIIGEHGPKSVGVFSAIKYTDADKDIKSPGLLGRSGWNGCDSLREKNQQIIQDTINWGPKLHGKYGTSGQEVCNSLCSLINRIYEEANGTLSQEEAKKFCSQTHYLNIKKTSIWRDIPEKYQKDFEGIFTGVPVNFRYIQESGKIRLKAFIDKRYAKDEYDFDLDKLSAEEMARFIDCIRTTVFGSE